MLQDIDQYFCKMGPAKDTSSFPELNFFHLNEDGKKAFSEQYDRAKEVLSGNQELAENFSNKKLHVFFIASNTVEVPVLLPRGNSAVEESTYKNAWETTGSLFPTYFNRESFESLRDDYYPFNVPFVTSSESQVIPVTFIDEEDGKPKIVCPATCLFISTKAFEEAPMLFRDPRGYKAYEFAVTLALLSHEGFHLSEKKIYFPEDEKVEFSEFTRIAEEKKTERGHALSEVTVYEKEIAFLSKYRDEVAKSGDDALLNALDYIIENESGNYAYYRDLFNSIKFSGLIIPPSEN